MEIFRKQRDKEYLGTLNKDTYDVLLRPTQQPEDLTFHKSRQSSNFNPLKIRKATYIDQVELAELGKMEFVSLCTMEGIKVSFIEFKDRLRLPSEKLTSTISSKNLGIAMIVERKYSQRYTKRIKNGVQKSPRIRLVRLKKEKTSLKFLSVEQEEMLEMTI